MTAIADSAPLLSICVPTFNRAASLKNLFLSLKVVKDRFGAAVEICISNNCSTDETAEIIGMHQEALDLRVIHQDSNIGGTLNIIAVAQLGRGHWGMWVGDDDELLPDGIGIILATLQTLEPDSWLLVEAASLDGRSQYLNGFREGRYTNTAFRQQILKTGLDPFGFMGVHLFPQAAKQTLQHLNLDDARPWPHMAALLRRIVRPNGGVQVLKVVATEQAKGGAKLFWSGGDLARIRMAKVRILRRLAEQEQNSSRYLQLLMLRELYSLGNIKALAAWKLYEPDDFRQFGFKTYIDGYAWLGRFWPLALAHFILLTVCCLLPKAIYSGFFDLIGQGKLHRQYTAGKQALGMFDGIKRGI